MPHVKVKLVPGKSEQQKAQLAEQIAKDIVTILHYEDDALSVAIEEVQTEDWASKVYHPEIMAHPRSSTKNPDTL